MPRRNAPIKVFLADDSALIRTRVAAMLGMPNMIVVGQAGTPQASIDGILETLPDVVVLDVHLAGGTGLEVLRAIHCAEPGIAFVVFSNNSGDAYRERYLREGAATFLDKSSEFNQLPRAVEAALGPRPKGTP
jgi:DNA-binding NarL/FixJ family response regulator